MTHPRSRLRIVTLGTALLLFTAGAESYPRDLAHSPGEAGQQNGSLPRPKKQSRPRFEEYQIPAGTTLPIALRTRLSSSSNRPTDTIEGRLLRPLTTPDGIELVPAGASVLGTVSVAVPASVKQPGLLTLTFHVVEHPETGSRAMINAAPLTFESQPPVKGKLFPDISLEKGADASVLLLAPLLVRLPIAN